VFLTDLFAVRRTEFFLGQLAEKFAVFFAEVATGFTHPKGLGLIGFL
jgi:hypothetical protein